MKTNITTIGGGSGTFNLLYGLKQNRDFLISAIVNVADSGLTSGEIRDQFGILPPGDVRRSLAALSEDTDMVRRLFEYRFAGETGLAGNKIGNLLVTALTDITGSFEGAVIALSRMLHVSGRVIPVTLDDVHIGVTLENGEKIIGEKNIDVPKHDPNLTITDAFLIGGGILNPRAREAILNSDFIIIGPGDLYTSIVPNLLCEGMREALRDTRGSIVYVCNAMTKHGETTNFEVEDFTRIIERYIGENRIDYVIVNNGHIPEEIVERYRREEGKKPLKVKDYAKFAGKTYRIVEQDLVNHEEYVRHDPYRLQEVIENIITGWIKR